MSYDIVVTSKAMGEGERDLTENLMLTFLHTLTEKVDLPDHLWFYGDGAFLTASGSQALDDLFNLAERGVDIATCGTCVNYYDLNDKIEVGTITSMPKIVDLFANSPKVVFPA